MPPKKIKILVLTTTFPRYKDDEVPSFVLDLSKEMKNLGAEIIILSPHDKNAKIKEKIEGMKIIRFPYFFPKKLQRLCYRGGIMYNIKKSYLAKIQIPFFFIFYFIYSYKIIKTFKIKAIHSHWIIPSGFVGAIFKKFFKIIHISTAHAIDVYTLEKTFLGKIITTFIFKNCDYIVCVSNILKQKLFNLLIDENDKKYFDKKVLVKPMGVKLSLNSFTNELNKEKEKEHFNILFLGRFVEKKGIKYLIYAFQKVLEKYKNVKLLLGGTGPLEEEIKFLVAKMNLKDSVKFLGWVPREELPKIMKEADFIVVPSIVTETGDTEGLPTVIIEAMGMGLPVIASDVGGIRDIIKDGVNGLLAVPGNVEDLSFKMMKIIENEELKKKLSKEGKETAKNYRWDKIAKFYIHLFCKAYPRRYEKIPYNRF
ncbi:MAG: glycosyltransferase family 4 protein [candidate division WOR-3 bacterium]